jgi:histidinol-phosphate aminotransferase
MNAADLRFDAAVNPYGCSPAVVEALEEAVRARAYRHYGDPDAGSLREKLARHFDLTPGHFLVYNGCGEGLVWQCVSRLLLKRRVFICPAPSYERFVAVGRRCAAEVVEVPLETAGWRLPVERFIEEARRHQASLAMISSPNNPTGNRLLDEASLATLLEALPGCTFIVDEAYAEYLGTSFAPLVSRFPNLVVLKTFSKAYGLAGLRVGYIVASPGVIADAKAFQIPWSVDTLALVAAEAALADQAYLHKIVAQIRADVATFGHELADIPYLRPSPTEANFFLAALQGMDDDRVSSALTARGLTARRRADMPGYLRLTCMTAEANQVLLSTLRKIEA